MALTKAFNEALASGNVLRIRIMMKDSLLNDPSFSEFKEMENSADGMKGLYDKHDGRDFKSDKNVWNDEYMNELMVQVVENFSHERINHLKEVVRYLRPDYQRQKQKDQREESYDHQRQKGKISDYQRQKQKDQRNGNYREKKMIEGAVIGGIVGTGVSAVFSLPVVGGLVVGAGAGAIVGLSIANES